MRAWSTICRRTATVAGRPLPSRDGNRRARTVAANANSCSARLPAVSEPLRASCSEPSDGDVVARTKWKGGHRDKRITAHERRQQSRLETNRRAHVTSVDRVGEAFLDPRTREVGGRLVEEHLAIAGAPAEHSGPYRHETWPSCSSGELAPEWRARQRTSLTVKPSPVATVITCSFATRSAYAGNSQLRMDLQAMDSAMATCCDHGEQRLQFGKPGCEPRRCIARVGPCP